MSPEIHTAYTHVLFLVTLSFSTSPRDAGNWQTHLAWLVSRSVVDTLYWTETVTMSRVDVVGEAGDVCVLMWLVVYSRSVVYTAELESALENGNEKRNVSRLLQLRVSDWPEQGVWDSNVLPTIFTRA